VQASGQLLLGVGGGFIDEGLIALDGSHFCVWGLELWCGAQAFGGGLELPLPPSGYGPEPVMVFIEPWRNYQRHLGNLTARGGSPRNLFAPDWLAVAGCPCKHADR